MNVLDRLDQELRDGDGLAVVVDRTDLRALLDVARELREWLDEFDHTQPASNDLIRAALAPLLEDTQ